MSERADRRVWVKESTMLDAAGVTSQDVHYRIRGGT